MAHGSCCVMHERHVKGMPWKFVASTSFCCCVQLSNAAQLLGGAYHVGSLADAAAVGPALKALVESALPQPLLATMASPRIKGSQQVTFHFLSFASVQRYILNSDTSTAN